jgi:hypothetical protein
MDIVTTISGLNNLVALKGVSNEEIEKAERYLSLSFAADYKAYLKKYGVISAQHIELTGIIASPRLNVVDVTLSVRQRNKVPEDMYVIEDTGIEGIIILQNAKGAVFELQNNRTEKIHDSLSGYLLAK